MKKRLLSLVMVFAMLFAFGATAMALTYNDLPQDAVYEGEMWQASDETNRGAFIMIKTGTAIELSISSASGTYVVFGELEDEGCGNGVWLHLPAADGLINATDEDEYEFYIDAVGVEITEDFKYDVFYGTMKEKKDIQAPFVGTQIINGSTVSKTGEYFAVVGGSISGTFQNGTHNIKATDHNLSIFLINQLNGQTRQMTSSTINSMSVTVAGGQITKIVINGRAQTTPGGFDTYTLTINY